MKTFLFFIVIGIILSSCGGGSDSGVSELTSDSTSTSTDGRRLISVASASALPTCNTETNGHVYYVEETSKFQTCKYDSTGWTNLDIGLHITSNKTISSSTTNICTQYPAESCFFNGGQRVTYSDGSIFIFALFNFSSVFIDNTAPDTDRDFDWDQSTVAFVIPENVTYAFAPLAELVARDSTGYHDLYIVYDRTSDQVKIVHDVNDNGPIDDITLFSPTLQNWGEVGFRNTNKTIPNINL